MFPPGGQMSSPQECHLKHHPVPMKRAVSPAAMAILRVACAGEEAAAKKDDAGLDRPTVSAVVAPVVERTVPLFKGLAARGLLRTQDLSEGTMIEAGKARIPSTAMHHASGRSAEMAPTSNPSDWRSQGGARFPCIEIRIVPLLKATHAGD